MSTQLTSEALRVKKVLEIQNLDVIHDDPLNTLTDSVRREQIAAHFEAILSLLSLDLTDESLAKTPHRVAKMYLDELFYGLDYRHFPEITLLENKMHCSEMITVKNIAAISTCEHHFVTIDGLATVAYIPNEKIIGLSKINRIVDFFAKRPQVQERLTQQILVALQVLLETDNVAVFIAASHYCVKARGIKDVGSTTTTTALGGIFKSDPSTRQEFLQAVK